VSPRRIGASLPFVNLVERRVDPPLQREYRRGGNPPIGSRWAVTSAPDWVPISLGRSLIPLTLANSAGRVSTSLASHPVSPVFS
jgi:hypothetical protein